MLGHNTKNLTDVPETTISISLLSKTVKTEDGQIIPGISVAQHCKITGYVAESLLTVLNSQEKENMLSDTAVVLAACHDIGKISPDFQKKIYSCLTDCDVSNYPEFNDANADNAKGKGTSFHAKVTQAALADCPRYISLIEGMHHGFKPNNSPIAEDGYGGKAWTQKRHELLSELEKEFAHTKNIWPQIKDWNEASVFGGFITVADWIASGGAFSKLTLESNVSDEQLRLMAEQAVADAGFRKVSFKQNLSFADVFGFAPRTAQSAFYEQVNNPGVYILEAPMGIGKTEAALYAAYKMIAAGKADGIYFGLPTQLTSNKIYERVMKFLTVVTGDEKNAVKLLHSSAWLETAVFGEDADSGKSWFDSGKRGILAPFAVGTVDQALMAVMNVKHGMVRAFGLAGKVVILDEVHSYDAYTGTILNTLVHCLREIGCTVIILSATLTAEQKKNILSVQASCSFNESYPLVTALPGSDSDQLVQTSVATEKEKNVHISLTSDDEEALDAAMEKAESGEQVLWIENTVSDAQKIYRRIAAKMAGTAVEYGLVHSRYIKETRAVNEGKWVSLYGSGNNEVRRKCGRILVGSQVLEQSLDIDADFLVTRLCPTDMMLQRMGRLWRHDSHNEVRPVNAKCSVLILSPEYGKAVSTPRMFGLSSAVYSEYVLLRTLEVWKEVHAVSLPSDIRTLLEKTYQDRIESGRLQQLKNGMIAKKKQLEDFARIIQSTAANTFTESEVQTRYSEIENCRVLLIKTFIKKDDSYEITFADSDDIITVPVQSPTYSEQQIRTVARILFEHCVTVAEKNAPLYDKTVRLFAPYVYVGAEDEDEHPFRAALVGDDEYLRTLQNTVVERDGKCFLYNTRLGYQIEKKGGDDFGRE